MSASRPAGQDTGHPGGDEARRRRRALVFGDVLPEATRDDRDESGEDPAGDAGEDWLRRQVPPHHG